MINPLTFSATTYSATFDGTSQKRIRTPHDHDVLSGRGGGINGHAGNVQFREWVRVRKNDYNLAQSKVAKAQVAKEVIELVQKQDPPGRFLQKDPSSVGGHGWWIELDEEKVMAKTSQALREGAPQIRAAHRDELEDRRSKTGRRSRKNTKGAQKTVTATSAESLLPAKRAFDETLVTEAVESHWDPEYLERQKAMEELRANAEAAKHANELDDETQDDAQEEEEIPPMEEERSEKRVRVDYYGTSVLPTDETPPLLPHQGPSFGPDDSVLLPPPAELPASLRRLSGKGEGLTRTHSLALSELSFGELDADFVNPFEDESDLRKDSSSFLSRPATIARDVSQASDLGGLGALFRSESARSGGSGSSGVRSRNSSGNVSTRYDGDLCLSETDAYGDALSYLPSYWWELENMQVPLLPQ